MSLLFAGLLTLALLCGCAPAKQGGEHALPGRMVPQPPGPATVAVRDVPGLGRVLVDGRGYTLYMFEPDGRHAVSCTDACAGSWPPLMRHGVAPRAGAGVRRDLLGSVPDPEGGRVVSYGGWPLYTYASDTKPGQANGQALDLNGGPWYVIRPSGKPVIPPEASGSGMAGMGG